MRNKYALLLIIALPIAALWLCGGPSRGSTQLDFQDPAYVNFESGVRRLRDGSYEVASLVNMPGVSADMVQWWFSDYLQTTEHYKLWHPTDHVWMAWEHKQPGQIIGAHHLVHEYLGGQMSKLRIQFVEPAEILGYDPRNATTTAICARVGELEGTLNISEMCHVVRNTPWGAEMRSRFWLGVVSDQQARPLVELALNVLVNNPLTRRLAVNQNTALAVHLHATQEMRYLGELLPQIYPGSEQ